MIISIDVIKAFAKIQYQFMIKTAGKLGIGRNFINLVKGICQKTYI